MVEVLSLFLFFASLLVGAQRGLQTETNVRFIYGFLNSAGFGNYIIFKRSVIQPLNDLGNNAHFKKMNKLEPEMQSVDCLGQHI